MQSSSNQKIKRQIRENDIPQSEWDVIPDYYGESGSLHILRAFESDEDVIVRPHPERGKRIKTAVLYCVMILFASLLMFSVVFVHTRISQQHIENGKIEETINSVSEEIDALEVKQNSLRDLNKVMKRAEELGMDFAESEEVEYIDIGYENTK